MVKNGTTLALAILAPLSATVSLPSGATVRVNVTTAYPFDDSLVIDVDGYFYHFLSPK